MTSQSFRGAQPGQATKNLRPLTLAGPSLTYLRAHGAWEQNSTYRLDLLTADDPWLWDRYGISSSILTRDFPFALTAPDTTAGEAARLTVRLQGTRDDPFNPLDHHVRVLVNGTLLTETHFDGEVAHTVQAALSPALLLDGANTLTLERGSGASAESIVQIDRFSLDFPRLLVPDGGVLEGEVPFSGSISVGGFGPGSMLLDTTQGEVRWLRSSSWGGDTLTFYAKAQHRYLAVAPQGILAPQVLPVVEQTLRDTSNQADWVLIAPRDYLDEAQPLVLHREAQGLAARSVALEDVYAAFSNGEPNPQAIKDFLAFAYHSWAQPSLRYVLLLGEATYDPKGYVAATSTRFNRLPTNLIRSPFNWTASDIDFAAVNGDDTIPDIAIGRLTVNDEAEAAAVVQKILDFESSGYDLTGKATLVADYPDPRAGDFEANVDDIAALMPTRPQVQKIFRSEFGVDTYTEVLSAFDQGLSVISYVGHGSYRLWAHNTVLLDNHADLLQAQSRQPLILTMTCSTGYFVPTTLNSIIERFVLVEGRGGIAAFAPTSESYNDAAHVFHSAMVQRLESGAYSRLGDLVLDAQVDYANSGAFPELLRLYHLFGDPALLITPAQ